MTRVSTKNTSKVPKAEQQYCVEVVSAIRVCLRTKGMDRERAKHAGDQPLTCSHNKHSKLSTNENRQQFGKLESPKTPTTNEHGIHLSSRNTRFREEKESHPVREGVVVSRLGTFLSKYPDLWINTNLKLNRTHVKHTRHQMNQLNTIVIYLVKGPASMSGTAHNAHLILTFLFGFLPCA